MPAFGRVVSCRVGANAPDRLGWRSLWIDLGMGLSSVSPQPQSFTKSRTMFGRWAETKGSKTSSHGSSCPDSCRAEHPTTARPWKWMPCASTYDARARAQLARYCNAWRSAKWGSGEGLVTPLAAAGAETGLEELVGGRCEKILGNYVPSLTASPRSRILRSAAPASAILPCRRSFRASLQSALPNMPWTASSTACPGLTPCHLRIRHLTICRKPCLHFVIQLSRNTGLGTSVGEPESGLLPNKKRGLQVRSSFPNRRRIRRALVPRTVVPGPGTKTPGRGGHDDLELNTLRSRSAVRWNRSRRLALP